MTHILTAIASGFIVWLWHLHSVTRLVSQHIENVKRARADGLVAGAQKRVEGVEKRQKTLV